MAEKEKIRPIYSELQGYLSQAPKKGVLYAEPEAQGLWVQVNQAIDELNQVSKKNYDRFRIPPNIIPENRMESVEVDIYRQRLGGLILRLHSEYFFDEPTPFSGMPSTVITQTQQQSQSQTQMLIDFTSKIDEEINKLEPGDTKRSFLEKVKGALGSVRDYAGLIALYVTTAKEFGLTLEEITELFK